MSESTPPVAQTPSKDGIHPESKAAKRPPVPILVKQERLRVLKLWSKRQKEKV